MASVKWTEEWVSRMEVTFIRMVSVMPSFEVMAPPEPTMPMETVVASSLREKNLGTVRGIHSIDPSRDGSVMDPRTESSFDRLSRNEQPGAVRGKRPDGHDKRG